jgi:eukaryotic-like serine/threonine-protein kinase
LATLVEVTGARTPIVAELFDEAEVADLVQAALEGDIAFVPLSGRLGEAPEPIELVAPGLGRSVRLMAELAGEACGGMFPVLLRPMDASHGPPLRDFVADVRRRARSLSARPTGAPAEAPAPPAGASEGRDQNEALPERRSSVPAPRSRRRSSEPPPEPAGGADPLIGRTLGAGRYRIEFLLGVGGMGRVYAAQHVALAKRIAVKVLDRSFQQDAQFAGRFHQEALAASKLDHKNVMQVLDFGQEPDGLLYIAMELLNGQNLASKVEREGAFPLGRVVHLMGQVLSALQAAHDRDIVHRDMKPENIVIVPGEDDDGQAFEHVKVCDFGLAKMTDDRASLPPPPGGKRAKLTMVGTVMGTPEYMSPEQCRGETMDLRTDLYACGVILYELLTGRVPFSSDNPMDILGMHCLAQPMSPRTFNPAISERLENVILKAMAKDREQRYASARQLRDALRAVAAASPAHPAVPALDVGGSLVEGFEATAFAAGVPVASREPSWPRPGDADGGIALAALEDAPPAPPASPAVEAEPKPPNLPPRADASEALAPAAEALLAGDQATREGARLALMSAGAPGVRALLSIREHRSLPPSLRPRWVTTVKEMGEDAVEPLVEALSVLDPLEESLDASLAEDLLRAVPESRDPDLAGQIDRFLLHAQVGIRRAAVQARVLTAVAGAEKALLRALQDSDEPTQLAAIAGVRKLGLVDRPAVGALDAILTNEDLSAELRAGAAAALGEVDASAKAPAESALLRAIQPRARSFMGLLRGDADASGEAMVIEAVAAALLKLGAAAARRAVERRAAQSRGEIKARLDRLLLRK